MALKPFWKHWVKVRPAPQPQWRQVLISKIKSAHLKIKVLISICSSEKKCSSRLAHLRNSAHLVCSSEKNVLIWFAHLKKMCSSGLLIWTKTCSSGLLIWGKKNDHLTCTAPDPEGRSRRLVQYKASNAAKNSHISMNTNHGTGFQDRLFKKRVNNVFSCPCFTEYHRQKLKKYGRFSFGIVN